MMQPSVTHEVRPLPVDEIVVADGRRPINEGSLIALGESVKRIGLQIPITARRDDVYRDPETGEVGRAYILIAGRHRLELFRRLGEKYIPGVLRVCDETEAELWEIAENLHRADLTKLERDVQIARWIDLTEGLLRRAREDGISAQYAPKLKPVVGNKGAGRPESGINAASRELGIERTDAQRAIKIASLPDEAKALARETGLDGHRGALLEASKEADDAAKTAKMREIAEREERKRQERAVRRAEQKTGSSHPPTAGDPHVPPIASRETSPSGAGDPSEDTRLIAAANAALRALRTPSQWADVASMNAEEWRAAYRSL
jgi:ParB family chromosome partitioning protein